MNSARLLAGGLIVIACIPHVPFLTAGCITDDFVHFAHLADHPRLAAAFQGPDPFGFFRPVQQATYLIDARISGFECSAASRGINLALHLAVVGAAFALATQVLRSVRAGLVAALIFALAPKAPTIAVFWISARAELLVSLFVLLGALAWSKWLRDGSRLSLAATAVCCVLAMLSKEAAALAPVAFLLIPGGTRSFRERVTAAATILGAGVSLVILLRLNAGAMVSAIQQGDSIVTSSPLRWLSNLANYVLRAASAPLLFILVVFIASRQWRSVATAVTSPGTRAAMLFGAMWCAVFIAPALPITFRSEIRVYLPAFGLAVVAAAVIDTVADGWRRLAAPAVIVTLVLAGYQVSRGGDARRTAAFQRTFVHALVAEPLLKTYRGRVAVLPGNSETARLLRDSVGGYGYVVIPRVLGRADLQAEVLELDQPAPANTLRVRCLARGAAVTLTPM